jgi:SAM-dependent methyltransferase
MDERFHAYSAEVEEWHWWYRVRRDILSAMLARLALPDGARLLDVGCGTGGMGEVLARFGQAVGLDRAPAALALAAQRPYRLRVGAALDRPLPLAADSFDLVGAFDVLEHLDDDAALARELYRATRPGGHAVVFVPAFRLLWGYNDEFSHHRRRYTVTGLRRVMESAGYRAVESGYFNLLLFAPTLAARLLQRALPRLTRGMEHGARPSPLNGALTRLFRLELPLLARAGGLPFGTSAYFIGRK